MKDQKWSWESNMSWAVGLANVTCLRRHIRIRLRHSSRHSPVVPNHIWRITDSEVQNKNLWRGMEGGSGSRSPPSRERTRPIQLCAAMHVKWNMFAYILWQFPFFPTVHTYLANDLTHEWTTRRTIGRMKWRLDERLDNPTNNCAN